MKRTIHKIESLNDLRPGQSGVVTHMTVQGSLKKRLIDMGITPGVQILVRKQAPFGDPIEISVRGYSLSLRKSDAKDIKITLVQNGGR